MTFVEYVLSSLLLFFLIFSQVAFIGYVILNAIAYVKSRKAKAIAAVVGMTIIGVFFGQLIAAQLANILELNISKAAFSFFTSLFFAAVLVYLVQVVTTPSERRTKVKSP